MNFKPATIKIIAITTALIVLYLVNGRLGLYQLIFPTLLFWVLWQLDRRFPHSRIFFPVTFGFLTLVNLALISQPPMDNPDSLGYWNLSRGNVTQLTTILYRPKFYPVFLSMFSLPIFAVVLQTLIKMGTLYLVYIFGQHRNWNHSTLAFILIMLGLNSMLIQEQNHILDTTLFTFLCMLAAFLFYRVYHKFSFKLYVTFGIVTGLCTLTRQVGDPFLFLGHLILLIRYRNQIRQAFVPALLFVLVGWSGMAVNFTKYNVPKRTVALGVNLYSHYAYYELEDDNSPEWNAIIKETGTPSIKTYWHTHFGENVNWHANGIPSIYRDALQAHGMTMMEADNYLGNKYFNWITNYPWRQVTSTVNEFCRLVFVNDEYYPESLFKPFELPLEVQRIERSLIHVPVWFFILILPMCLAYRKFQNKLALSILTLVTAYFIIISFAHIGFTRYALPALPFLFLAMGDTFNSLLKKKTLNF